MAIDVHILISFDKVFQQVIAFTEKDDNTKAEWRNGTTQSLDDDLVNLTETVELKLSSVWLSPAARVCANGPYTDFN